MDIYHDNDVKCIEEIQYKNWESTNKTEPPKGKGIFLVRFVVEPKNAALSRKSSTKRLLCLIWGQIELQKSMLPVPVSYCTTMNPHYTNGPYFS